MTFKGIPSILVVLMISGGLSIAPAQQQEPGEPPPDSTEKETQAGGESGAASTAQDAALPQRPPSAEEVLRAFQKDRPTNTVISPRRSPDRATGEGPEGGNGAAGLLRDGDYLNKRPGRLVKEGPWWAFVFESDSGEAPQPPMRLLPNQQLERMVRETEASAESVVFVVAGEVTLFDSRNYLLVRMALRRKSMDNLHN